MRSKRSRKAMLAVVLTAFLLSALVGSLAAFEHMQAWPTGDDYSDQLWGGGGRRVEHPLRHDDPGRAATASVWSLLRLIQQELKFIWLP